MSTLKHLFCKLKRIAFSKKCCHSKPNWNGISHGWGLNMYLVSYRCLPADASGIEKGWHQPMLQNFFSRRSGRCSFLTYLFHSLDFAHNPSLLTLPALQFLWSFPRLLVLLFLPWGPDRVHAALFPPPPFFFPPLSQKTFLGPWVFWNGWASPAFCLSSLYWALYSLEDVFYPFPIFSSPLSLSQERAMLLSSCNIVSPSSIWLNCERY